MRADFHAGGVNRANLLPVHGLARADATGRDEKRRLQAELQKDRKR
jgi:hypothetical protein